MKKKSTSINLQSEAKIIKGLNLPTQQFQQVKLVNHGISEATLPMK
jgi:hypothetical protein